MAEILKQKEQQQQQEEELANLTIDIDQSIQRATLLSIEQDVTWNKEINFLAEKLERKYILLGQQFLIETISQEITRIYRLQNIRIWQDVRHFLPSRFKNGYELEETDKEDEESSIHFRDDSRNLLEELKLLKKSGIGDIPREQISDYEYVTKNLHLGFHKRAEQEHIALESEADKDKQKGDPLTTDKPRPHGSLMYDEAVLFAEDWKGVIDRIFQFPPEILAKDQELAAGIRTFRGLFNAALDLKYSKSPLDWFKAERYRDIYGKHAAAVLSFSVTNLCASCSDENTKEWVRMEPVFNRNYETYQCFQCNYKIETICPVCNVPTKLTEKDVVSWQCENCQGNVPMQRDLTREQIGDKSSVIMDGAIQVIEHIPLLISFCNWFRDWIDPRVGGRKKRLGPELSNEA